METTHGQVLEDLILKNDVDIKVFAEKIGYSRGHIYKLYTKQYFNKALRDKIIAAIGLNRNPFESIQDNSEYKTDNSSQSNSSKGNIIKVPTFAQAGFGRGFADMEHKSTFERYFMPGIEKGIYYDIPVEGDSMYSTLANGDRVLCKHFSFKDYIRWGEVYVIVLKEGDGNIIKRIKPGTSKETITIVSDNPEYDPYQMPLAHIQDLFIVFKFLSDNLGKRNGYAKILIE